MFTILDERKSIVLDTSVLMDDYTSIGRALSLYNEVIINIKEGGNNNIVTKKYIIR